MASPSDGSAETADLSAPAAPTLTRGTLVAAAFCIFAAQFGLTVPAILNGLFQLDFS